MIEQALLDLETLDTLAVIARLNAQEPASEVVKTYDALLHKLYWEHKDVTRMVLIGRAGMQFALDASQRADDVELGRDLLGQAKTIAYNLSANLWPGWGEADINLDDALVQIGHDAARTNLRLAVELKRDALPLSRAYWLMGAHNIAAREYDDARQNFAQAAEFATQADHKDESLLAQGFIVLVDLLQKPGEQAAKQALDALLAELKTLENGDAFAEQITTAYAVFKGEPG